MSKSDNQSIVGMQARYIEYKTRENEIHGNFQRGRNLQSWSIPRNIDYNASDGVSRFYVHPDVVDSLFKANYDTLVIFSLKPNFILDLCTIQTETNSKDKGQKPFSMATPAIATMPSLGGVWDEPLSAHTIAGSMGVLLSDAADNAELAILS